MTLLMFRILFRSFYPTLCKERNTGSRISRNMLNSYIPLQTFLDIQPSSSKFHTTNVSNKKIVDIQPTEEDLAPRKTFFGNMTVKDKSVFVKAIDSYDAKDRLKRGHLEFIYAALSYMEEFGVQYDLDIYKKLMDIFPKGKLIAKNMIQAEFYHFVRHQECGLHILDKMDYLGVYPDKEMGEIILTCFGKSSHVYKKFCRMMYWMPKLKNINPYLLPDPLPSDVRELARLALKKMSVDLRAKITEHETEELEDAVDKTWILSSQSPVQQKLIEHHAVEKSLYVEGPYLVWLRRLSMTYFILRADPKIYPDLYIDDDDVSNLSLYMFGEPKPQELTIRPATVHEQEEGIIMGMCCTGTSSKDSLLSWIRFLRKSNPKLDAIPVLFTLRTSPTSIVAVNATKQSSETDNPSKPFQTAHQGSVP